MRISDEIEINRYQTEIVRIDAKATIDSDDVKGEPYTGYENPEGKGPFQCSNCSFSHADSTCGQPIMVKHSKQPRTDDGRVKIDPHGCCEYVNRIGKS